MTLRSRLLAAFAALAVVPLLAVGVFDYLRTATAVQSLIVNQTSALATQAAASVESRFRLLEANIALLAGNAETSRLFAAHARGDTSDGANLAGMAAYLGEAWLVAGRDLMWASYRTTDGRELFAIGERDAATTARARVVQRDVRDDRGTALGAVVFAVRIDSLLADASVRTHFGRQGLVAVVDDASGAILATDADESIADQRVQAVKDATPIVVPPENSLAASPTDGAPRLESYAMQDRDSSWIGARASVAGAGLSVISLASRDELSAPFTAIRDSSLATVALLTTLVAMAFVALLWRGTQPLAELTRAADEVAAGNLSPRLPIAGTDEAGRLSGAFAYMLQRIRSTLDEMDRGRRMAVIGEFASQVAHEIRNPLTGMKLNLQRLDRAAVDGRLPAEFHRPIEITRLEVDRLDRVVRGVLQLGQGESGPRTTFMLREPVERALDAVRPEAERADVAVHTDGFNRALSVTGHAERLQGLVLNLLRNALEASPPAGRLVVTLAEGMDHTVHLTVEDDGPGIADGMSERIFAPFVTTKPDGTGLGLALAQRVVEDHAGTITVVAPRVARGAAFRVTLSRASETA